MLTTQNKQIHHLTSALTLTMTYFQALPEHVKTIKPLARSFPLREWFRASKSTRLAVQNIQVVRQLKDLLTPLITTLMKGDSLAASLSNPAQNFGREGNTEASVRIESAFSF